MSDPIDKARDTLVRALEQLDKGEEKIGGKAERVDLVVVYALGRDQGNGKWEHTIGWVNTPGPGWVFEKLMDETSASVGRDNDVVDPGVDDE